MPVPLDWLLPDRSQETFVSFILNWENTNTKVHVEENCVSGLEQLLFGEKIWKLWKVGASPLDSKRESDFIFDMKIGDVLFVPSGWWHSVETLSGGFVMVNCQFSFGPSQHRLLTVLSPSAWWGLTGICATLRRLWRKGRPFANSIKCLSPSGSPQRQTQKQTEL